jgi:uncharacterized protein (UPF0218 family)
VKDLRPERRYVLPVDLRSAVAGGYGTLLRTDDVAAHLAGRAPVAAVGDVVAMTLHDLQIRPRLFVCDYHTKREHYEAYERVLGVWGDREIRVRNPAATITRDAWDAVRRAFAAPASAMTRIVVDGEEDLLGIPCFIECPVGGVVCYGRPGKGFVAVDITPEFQEKVRGLVERMVRE